MLFLTLPEQSRCLTRKALVLGLTGEVRFETIWLVGVVGLVGVAGDVGGYLGLAGMLGLAGLIWDKLGGQGVERFGVLGEFETSWGVLGLAGQFETSWGGWRLSRLIWD